MERIFCDICEGEINEKKETLITVNFYRKKLTQTASVYADASIHLHVECFKALPLPELKWKKH